MAIAGANYGARLAGSTNVKGMKFLGAAPALFDLFSSSGDGELPDVEWSQLAPPIGFQSNGTNFYDEILFDLDVLDPRTAGAKLAGIPAELVDAFGATVVDTTTDSEGRIVFGSGQQVNRVKACLRTAIAGVPTRIDQFPFTLKLNHKGATNAAFLPQSMQIIAPGRDYTGGRQFGPLSLCLPLVPTKGIGQEEYRAAA